MSKNITKKRTKSKTKEAIQTFQELISEDTIQELAMEVGVHDERVRDLPIYPFTLLMIIGNSLGKEVSLKHLVQCAFEWDLTEKKISSQRLSQQVAERSSAYFQKLFEALLKKALELPRRVRRKIEKHFGKINILDSTVIRLCSTLLAQYEGTKGQAAIKLHTRFNLIYLLPEAVIISAGKVHDNKVAPYDRSVDENILNIMDLGYTDFEEYQAMMERSHDFVVRRKRNAVCKVVMDLTGCHEIGRAHV